MKDLHLGNRLVVVFFFFFFTEVVNSFFGGLKGAQRCEGRLVQLVN